MADDVTVPKELKNNSLKDDGFPIGGKAGGGLDIFPLSELAARIAERDHQEAVIAGAIAQSEGEDLDDISDLED